MRNRIQAAVLSLALLLPGSSAFARTHHVRRAHSYTTTTRYYTYRRPHHYSQTRGAIIGGVAGAILGHGVKGALIGAAVGDAVQYERNREARRGH